MSSASVRSSGVKSIRSSSVNPCISNAAGRVGIGCVGDSRSPGTSDCGTGRSSIGQIGSPVTRSNVNAHPCLVVCTTTSRGRPSTVTFSVTGAVGLS